MVALTKIRAQAAGVARRVAVALEPDTGGSDGAAFAGAAVGGFGGPPWEPVEVPGDGTAVCNICRWRGPRFGDPVRFCEGEVCSGCGSIARERFLHWCAARAGGLRAGQRVLETSPRMGEGYRAAMRAWFDYTPSDYDERAHRGSVRLDLQAIDRPDTSFDTIMTAHVLEHVPDTDRALAELRRILAADGVLALQVPVLQGATAPPAEPEFHGDDTPVFWRFGFDLTDRIRRHGFEVRLGCTAGWSVAVRDRLAAWPGPTVGGFDVADMLPAGTGAAADLEVVASDGEALALGWDPAYMYLTWMCRPV